MAAGGTRRKYDITILLYKREKFETMFAVYGVQVGREPNRILHTTTTISRQNYEYM